MINFVNSIGFLFCSTSLVQASKVLLVKSNLLAFYPRMKEQKETNSQDEQMDVEVDKDLREKRARGETREEEEKERSVWRGPQQVTNQKKIEIRLEAF